MKDYRQHGLALPIVLALIALLQLLALAQLDTTTVLLRSVTGLRDRVTAYYAADAALVLCAQQFANQKLSARLWTGAGEPVYWRTANAFDANHGLAVRIATQWPGAAFGPQCLLEMSTTGSGQTAVQHYLLTAKGGGSLFQSRAQSSIPDTATQIWLQVVQLVHASEVHPDSASRWFWRSVAEAPQ